MYILASFYSNLCTCRSLAILNSELADSLGGVRVNYCDWLKNFTSSDWLYLEPGGTHPQGARRGSHAAKQINNRISIFLSGKLPKFSDI
jgi:hypothetical protein